MLFSRSFPYNIKMSFEFHANVRHRLSTCVYLLSLYRFQLVLKIIKMMITKNFTIYHDYLYL